MDAKVSDYEPDSKEMSDLLLRVMRGVNGQAFRLLGSNVLLGPFTGMIIPAQTPHWDDGNSGTKLLGVYEHELHGSFEYALSRLPAVVINVGCGEGYYAIGLASLLPQAFVIALDIDEDARMMCEDYAEKNGVKVNLVDGARSAEELRFENIRANRLYVVDVEGNEIELLDLDRCPELRDADLIIECHDFMRPGVSKVLADRFAATHRVEMIQPKLPDFEQFPFLKSFPSAMAVLLVVEKRPMPCCWLACWANTRGERNG